MGKKLILWTLVAFLLVVTADLIGTKYHIVNVVPLMVTTFVVLMVITRLIFDLEYQQTPWNRILFPYVVSTIVCLTFLFSIFQILPLIYQIFPSTNVANDDIEQVLRNYEQRISDVRDLNISLGNRIAELDGDPTNIITIGPLDLLSISERDSTLRDELAVRNEESVGATAISIEKEDGDFVRGKVVFATEPKKNGTFFGRYSRDNDQWEVYLNEANDGLPCEGGDLEIEIPKSMLEGCEKYKSDGDIRVGDDWKLTSGNPHQNCSQVEYSGEVKVKSWLEWRTNYVEKSWLLAVAKDDSPKLLLGGSQRPYFNVQNLSEKLRTELMNASVDYPVTVIVKKISYYCEGRPSVEIEREK